MDFQLERCRALLGRRLVTEAREIPQAMINAFGEATEDRQFIHTDPQAAAKTAFGGTIAHGFLLLSLLPAMAEEIMPPLPNQIMLVNAGFDRVRFVSPCPSGSQLRGAFELQDLDEPTSGQIALKWDVTLEDPADLARPRVAARWLTRIFIDTNAT